MVKWRRVVARFWLSGTYVAIHPRFVCACAAVLAWLPLINPAVSAGEVPAEATLRTQAQGVSAAPPNAALDTVNGLYPLWEHTGVLHNTGTVQLGYQRAQVGLGYVQVSTQPILDLYGTLNLQAKVAVLVRQRLKVAVVTGVYRIPTNAQARMFGNLNSTGLVNPYGPLYVAPLSLAKSLLLSTRWAVHWASTLLLASGEGQHRVAGGQALLFEAIANHHWRARIHAGVEGLNVEEQGHAALSFAYRGDVVHLEAGAGQRITFAGERATFVMFDGALVF